MKDLDSVKIVLMASLLLCLTGIGLYYFQIKDLEELTAHVPLAKNLLTQIGEVSDQVDMRKTELDRDKRLQQGLKLRKYLEQQAHDAGINYSRYFKIERESELPDRPGGFVDQPHKITTDRKKQFHRQAIAKFIFNIENFTNRLKVTELYLDKPSDDCENWNMQIKIVERAPLEKS